MMEQWYSYVATLTPMETLDCNPGALRTMVEFCDAAGIFAYVQAKDNRDAEDE